MTHDEFISRALLEKALYFIELQASDQDGAHALIDTLREHLMAYPAKASTDKVCHKHYSESAIQHRTA